MPENDQERRAIVITFNFKILMIVIVTVAVTFLFIRSNQTMVNTPTFVRKMYTTVDAGLMANKSENQLILTAVNITTVTNSTKDIVTHHPLSQKHDGMWKNDLQEELKQFRSGKTGLIQDDYILVKPTLHWKKFNRYINKNKIDKSLPAYNVEYNNSGVTANDGMYQMDTGSNSINHEYSTIDVNIPLYEENNSNNHYNHYNVNDSSYNSGSYTYKEMEIPVDGIKSVTDGQSEHINTLVDLSLSGSGSNAYRQHLHHDFKPRYPTGQALYYKPSADLIPLKNRKPSKYVTDDELYYKPVSQQPSNINFRSNSAVLLITLGILKLTIVGILQILFLIGFKLKIFTIAIFAKFLLFMKLLKMFKIITLPFILLSSLLVFASMLNGTNNASASTSTQSSLLSMLLPSLFNNNMAGSSSTGSSGSASSSSSFPAGSSFSSSSSSTIPSDISPDLLEFLLSGSSRESSDRLFLDKSCDSSYILQPDLSLGGTIQSGENEHPYFTSKAKDSKIFNRQLYKSVEVFDPTLTISQNMLYSEKCVERRACRLAVAEKAGIIPSWIKLWILNGVSKLISEEKYELYFKTYNLVNNEIETTKTSLTPENWEKWCLERYNSDNITNRKK